MIVLANNIKIPPNSFKLFMLYGSTKQTTPQPVPLVFNNYSAMDMIRGKKILIKSAKAFYLLSNPPTINTVVNKVITNEAKEITGYELHTNKLGFLPRDSVAFGASALSIRLLINGKHTLFTSSVAHPMFDIDNFFLLIDEPVQTFELFITDLILSSDEIGNTNEDILAYVEMGIYIL